jgi:hypothetical protein
MKKVTMVGMFAVLALCTTYGVSEGQGPIRRFLFGAPANQTCVNGNCNPASVAATPAPAPVVLAPGQTKMTVKAGPVAHTLAHEFVRLKVAAGLRAKGYSVQDANTLAGSLSDEMMENAAAAVGAPSGFFQQLLQELITFINSPQGQQIMAALIQLLIHLIGG